MVIKQLFVFFVFFLGSFSYVSVVSAQNAILYFSPESGMFVQGEIFSSNIFVDTRGEGVNAIAAHFSYPEALLEVLTIEVDTALIEFNKGVGGGVVKIDVAKLPPALIGIQKVASVRFLAKAPGEATLTFTSDTVVLRNSDNQDILNRFSLREAVITIVSLSDTPTPPPVIPTTPSPPPAGEPTPSVLPEQVSVGEVTVSDVTENSAVVSWKTEIPSISKIVYNGQTFLDGFVTTDHRVLLQNLMPDTEYTFQIGEQTNEGQFRTSAAGRQGQEQSKNKRKCKEKYRISLTVFPGDC